jgi:hypothetical protein
MVIFFIEEFIMKFRHVCSPEDLMDILETGEFYPCHVLTEGGDSGINGFLVGETYRNQQLSGEGAEFVIDWQEPYQELLGEDEVIGSYNFPLPADTLCHHRNWRATIPMGTDRVLIGVIDFRVDSCILNPVSRVRLEMLRRRLKAGKIYVEIKECRPSRTIPRSTWDWLLRW